MSLRHDQGIVLRSHAFGEADRVVVLVSPVSGKLRTVAKGVRKTTSKFGGRLEPFTRVDLVLWEGRGMPLITQAEVLDAFPRLRGDLDRVTAASTMVEVVDAVAQEDEPSVAIFEVLLGGLSALEAGGGGPDLVTGFLLHAVEVVGLAPALEACASCGRTGDLTRFGFAAGGVVCESCRPEGAVRLRAGLTDHLAALARTPLRSVGSGDPDLATEAMGVMRRFVEYHLDRRLSSLAVLA